jgi:hypothetical protein
MKMKITTLGLLFLLISSFSYAQFSPTRFEYGVQAGFGLSISNTNMEDAYQRSGLVANYGIKVEYNLIWLQLSSPNEHLGYSIVSGLHLNNNIGGFSFEQDRPEYGPDAQFGWAQQNFRVKNLVIPLMVSLKSRDDHGMGEYLITGLGLSRIIAAEGIDRYSYYDGVSGNEITTDFTDFDALYKFKKYALMYTFGLGAEHNLSSKIGFFGHAYVSAILTNTLKNLDEYKGHDISFDENPKLDFVTYGISFGIRLF